MGNADYAAQHCEYRHTVAMDCIAVGTDAVGAVAPGTAGPCEKVFVCVLAGAGHAAIFLYASIV